MKSKDIGLIAIIAVFSAIISIIASNYLIPSGDKQQSVEVIGPISSDFQRPPDEYYNQDSINPTQEIKIGEDENSKPFDSN